MSETINHDLIRKVSVITNNVDPLTILINELTLANFQFDISTCKEAAEKELNPILFIDCDNSDHKKMIQIASAAKKKVIAVMDKDQIGELEELYEAGLSDYIFKPLFQKEVHSKINLFACEIDKYIAIKSLIQDKNEFIGIVAHDLKNPIYSINMLGKLFLEDESLTKDEIQEFASDIVSSSQRMFDLIAEILDFNAIESGKTPINLEMIDICMVVSDVIDNYRMRAQKKNIKLKFTNNAPEAYIWADNNAIIQIMDNLVSNALKFSPTDKNITVILDEIDSFIHISIVDEGPGFSKKDQEKVFEKFVKLSAKPTANENSTGLGLSIVKSYVEKINSSIDLVSEEGNGAKFIIKVPKFEI